MFQYIKKVLVYLRTTRDRPPETEPPLYKAENFRTDLDENLSRLRRTLGRCPDVFMREFNIGQQPELRAALVLIDGMTNTDLLDSNILKPLMFDILQSNRPIRVEGIEDIDRLVPFCKTSVISTFEEATDRLTSGNAVLFVLGFAAAVSIDVRNYASRPIEEPMTESLMRGPHEGFTESLFDNLSMLRRRIKNPKLRLEAMKIGKSTHTDVIVAYIEGTANQAIVEEVRNRLEQIVIDSVSDSGYIEAYIQDAPYSIFNTVGNSERPDVISSRLLEGRVAIFSDGSPFVLTVPMLYVENFQSAGDYYVTFYFSNIMRIIRLLSFFITTMIPAVYVALATFHQELIPSTLLYTFVSGHKAIPLPTILEALLMLFFFDIMFEAGLRLPKSVGSAVSIVGALVIGEAAVSAGLISAPMVIVVALTAISSFVVSPQIYSALILRYYFTLLGGMLGGFGIVMGLMVVLYHMFSLKSFGVPYMATLHPSYSGEMEDSILMFPIWRMYFRPKALRSSNKTRRRGGPAAPDKS
jgi:spore germination protein KA